MAKKKVRVVILVEGGAVQAVYAPQGSGVAVTLVDFDNLNEEGKGSDEREAILKREKKGLVELPY